MESLIHQQAETLSLHLEHGVTLEVANTDVVLRQQAVFGLIFAELKHRRIAKFW